MNPSVLLLGAGLLALLAAIAGLVLLRGARDEKRVQQRLRGIRGQATPARAVAPPPRAGLLGGIAAFGGLVARSGLLPARTLAEFEHTLVSSGLRGRNGLGLFIGSKILLLLLLPVIAWLVARELSLSPMLGRLLPLGAAAAGLLLPDMILRRNRDRYLQRLERGLPDALDMLVICAQAGLGLEPAMRYVATEIASAHPEIAQELAQTNNEMRISVDSQRVLLNFGTRTGLATVKRVTSTLAQTLQYGTPLTDALRTLSAELRQFMLIRFEERAAKLPVVLTLPMVLFIFPCVFIVTGGPAVLQIMKAFGR